MAWRLRQALNTPQSEEAAAELERSLALIDTLDKAFAVYDALVLELEEAIALVQHIEARRLEAKHQANHARVLRKQAHLTLSQWEHDNRFRLRFHRAMGRNMHPRQQELKDEVTLHHRHIQELNQRMRTHEVQVHRSDENVRSLESKKIQATTEIRRVLVSLEHSGSSLLPELLRWLDDADEQWVRQELPGLFPSPIESSPSSAQDVAKCALDQRCPTATGQKGGLRS